MTNDDMRLVREYVSRQSESAFTTLVSRHANLVYSAALRQLRDSQLAEEATQAVFIILARKAGSVGARTILPGWLYRTACYVAGSALKRERRRQRREQEAYMQSTLHEAQSDSTWEQMSPLLEEAMLRLGQADRDALVLRFFEGRSLNEVGSALGASEEAAKKRVNRALEKLRAFFKKRGISTTTGIISGAISANSVHAAPMGLAHTICTVALVKGATAGSSTLTLIKGALKIMAWTKAKTAIVAGATILLAGGATTAIFLSSGRLLSSANRGQNNLETVLRVSTEFFDVPDGSLNNLEIRWQPMNAGSASSILDQSKLDSILRTLSRNSSANLVGKPRVEFGGLPVGKTVGGVLSVTRSVKVSGTNANVGITLNVAASVISTDFKSFDLDLNAEWRDLVDVSASQRAIRTTTAKVSSALSLGQTIVIRQPINGSEVFGKLVGAPESLLIFATPQVLHERLKSVTHAKRAK